jgi:hypothetical protein
MTAQEVELVFHRPKTVSQIGEDAILVDYDIFQLEDCDRPAPPPTENRPPSAQPRTRPSQGLLFE